MDQKEKKRTRKVLRKQRDVGDKQQQERQTKLFCLDVGLIPSGIKKEKKKSNKVAFCKNQEEGKGIPKGITFGEGLGTEGNNDNHLKLIVAKKHLGWIWRTAET